MSTLKSSKSLAFICLSASMLFCCIIAFVCYFVLKKDEQNEGVSFNLPKVNEPSVIIHQAQAEDYEKVLIQMNKIKDQILDIDHYSRLVFSHGNEQPKTNFADLSELEKRVLIMELADGFTKRTTEMAKMWQAEIDTEEFKNDNYEKELLDLRKNFAASYEGFVEKTCEQFTNEISEKERSKILRELKTLHEKLGLIKR